MNAERPLTAAHLRYLLAMRRLAEGAGEGATGEGPGVRSVSMARALGLRKSTVHAMLVSLQAMGLVRKSDYGSAFFTPQGRALADRYHRYFQAVRGMLESRFPRCPALDDAACALLAALPPESLERFCAGPPIPKGEL